MSYCFFMHSPLLFLPLYIWRNLAAGMPGAEAFVYKQALIGWLLTPGFLADHGGVRQ
jgi:hypothetical protein